MPTLSPLDQVALHISTLKKSALANYQTYSGRNPFPVSTFIKQVVSDRLKLAGEHLSVGDRLISTQQFRSSISRHYYAMYHAARAVVFVAEQGDDHERHAILPRNLPKNMHDVSQMEADLTNARLLRNQADYDIYPISQAAWADDAREIAATSATFVKAFEDFALMNGYL